MSDHTRPLLAPRDPLEALMLLSRYPLPALSQLRGARAAWAYPLAGMCIAAPVALLCAACAATTMPPAIFTLLGLAALTLSTGALHEDGLADCADGFWGGRSRDKRLEIMKDSRVGSYGVLALVFSVGLRWACLWGLFAHSTTLGASSLIAAALISRAAMPAMMWALPAARPSGLAGSVGEMTAATSALAAVIGLVAALALNGRAGLIAVLVVLCIGTIWALIAQRKIGGYTGDVLGGTQQLTEISYLCTIVSLI